MTGVFDLMQVYLGDGEVDLARTSAEYVNDPSLGRAFVDAYRNVGPFRPRAGGRFTAYMLLDRLQVWEYAQRHGRLQDQSLRAWAEPFLRLGELIVE